MTASMATKLYPRLLTPPEQAFFLFGPRGSGKSTWAKRAFPGAYRFDLLDEELYQELLSDASLFAARLRTFGRRQWVWVDEVQRLPSLLNEVHRFIEDAGLRFILTGSSARKLRRTGVNLLAGRALTRTMYPLLPAELGRDFDLDNVLSHGSLPIVWSSPSKQETLKAYVQTYLKEEIQAEALARNLAGFARFLPIAALFHAQTLNVSALARDAGVSRMTVSGYLDVLEDTLLAFRLPAYEAKLRVRERKHPKLYWIDPGLVRAVKRQLTPLAQEERGALLEGFVAVVLKAYSEYTGLFDDFAYWSPTDAAGTEVDFLLRKGNHSLAIEVKSSPRLSGDAFRGLRAIGSLRGLRRRVLIYTGAKELRTEDGIEVWPVSKLFHAIEGSTLF
jgi:predicted AAA+ superfamily ATPase